MAFHPTIILAGGRITCRRCQAHTKRAGDQCRKAAMRGKAVCRTHGGASTGPKTEHGRNSCAAAKTVHGRETRPIRTTRAVKLKELRGLERLLRENGLL
jgi:hypothetical protein